MAKPKPRRIDLMPDHYQPTKAEMEEGISLDTTPEKLAKSVLQPVEVHRQSIPEHKARRAG